MPCSTGDDKAVERDLREVPVANGDVALDLSPGAYQAMVLTLE